MSEYSLGQAMKLFLQKSRLQSGIRSLEIATVWEELMGKTIAKYTDKIQIINHTLFITTNIAPLKNELLYQKDKIIQRVNEAMGENIISEVVIRYQNNLTMHQTYSCMHVKFAIAMSTYIVEWI